MDKFKCIDCGVNEVEHEDDICDECYYNVDDEEFEEEDEEE